MAFPHFKYPEDAGGTLGTLPTAYNKFTVQKIIRQLISIVINFG